MLYSARAFNIFNQRPLNLMSFRNKKLSPPDRGFMPWPFHPRDMHVIVQCPKREQDREMKLF
jgi:hypothetical protein